MDVEIARLTHATAANSGPGVSSVWGPGCSSILPIDLNEIITPFSGKHSCGSGCYCNGNILVYLAVSCKCFYCKIGQIFTGRPAQCSYAGIVFTQRSKNGFFAPQRRHVAPINVKFGMGEPIILRSVSQLSVLLYLFLCMCVMRGWCCRYREHGSCRTTFENLV